MIGRRLGRYRVTEKIGQGGMATVWKAEDELLGRTVAVKVLAETLAGSPDARRRFLHEARAARLLDHPGIVAVHEAGETEGRVWMAMDFVDGETLAACVTRRLMPVAEAVRIACAAAAALGHAHARGIVHRDVTARNIMVARDERVVVLDFGLALVEGESRVTTSRTVLGTLAYLAPEVIVGHDADPRTDLYGLGVVLYEALTGAQPFSGDRPEALHYAIVNLDPVAPRARRAEIPPALERIVLRAMARRPEDRYPHAEDLGADLRAFLAAPGEPAAVSGEGAAAPRAPCPEDTLAPAPGTPVYLAVLAFSVEGPSAVDGGATSAFGFGLAGTVAAALGGLPGLRVIPPAAAAPPAEIPPRELAQRLGATHLLSGSVRRAGARLRLSWSLLDAASGVQTAGDTLDGTETDLFELEDRLLAGLRRALGEPAVGPPGPQRPRPRDPAARERYLQALGYLQRYDNAAAVDGAVGLLEGLLASEGDRADLQAALGRAYLCKHRLSSQHVWADRAAAACERALALDAEDPTVLLTRAELRASVGRYPEAIADYRHALELRPDLPEALLGLALACVRSGDMPAAEEAAQRAIAARQRDWRGYSMLGYVYFQEGRYARALEPWRHAVRLAPDNAHAQRNVGSAYLLLGRLEEGVAAYRKSVEVEPTPTGYSNLGTALFDLGRDEEAVQAFERATALAPSYVVAWCNLGCALHFIPGREAEAATVLERAVEMMRDRLRHNPGAAQDWCRLASLLEDLDRRAEAREAMERALAIAPHDARVLARAAGHHCHFGDYARALEYVREAVQHGHGVGLLLSSRDLAPLHDDPEFRRIVEEAATRPPRAKGAPGGRERRSE